MDKYILTDLPTDLDKYIQTDVSDGFRQVYSDRFGRRIWTSKFWPIWPTDLDKYISIFLPIWPPNSDKYIQTDLADGFGLEYKYILTDLADGFEKVNSNRFRQVFKNLLTNLATDMNKYILTDCADGFVQVNSGQFGRRIWTSM